MIMSDNPTKYEVLIEQYLRSILDISVSNIIFYNCFIYLERDFGNHGTKAKTSANFDNSLYTFGQSEKRG